MKTLLNVFAALMLFAPAAFATAPIESTQVGMNAPEFSLPGSDGKTHALSDYKGKIVVLEWSNFECPYVKKHYESANMQRLQGTYVPKGAVWLTILSSAPGKQGHLAPEEAAKAAKERDSRATAVLIDSDGAVGKAYGAKNTPHMFVLDAQHKIAYAGAIDDRASFNKEDIEGAKNYVAGALDELMEGKNVSVAATRPYGCSVKY